MTHFAIISVSNKDGVETLAKAIEKTGRTIISTGKTASYLESHGVNVVHVSDFTGFPEILSGRVKSLHPKIYAGILALQTIEHTSELAKLSIPLIDFVVINFYPFVQMQQHHLSTQELLEYMDVGGPCMLRAAVKGFERVSVVIDPLDYSELTQQLTQQGEINLKTREHLAVKAMESLVVYDSQILEELSTRFEGIPRREVHVFEEIAPLRYGENPHQSASVMHDSSISADSFSQMKVLSGKQLSYNNYLDMQFGYKLMQEMGNDTPVCCIIKHGIPCGVATGTSITDAFKKAWQADSVSAFGGIVLVNRELSPADTDLLGGKFVEIIVAPDFSDKTSVALQQQGKNRRLIAVQFTENQFPSKQNRILGSIVLQQDSNQHLWKDFQIVSGDTTDCMKKQKLAIFAIKVSKHLLSNAICIVWEYAPEQYMTVGIGCGQPNRIDALSLLAVPRARGVLGSITQNQLAMADCVVASDGFFPFVDSIEQIHAAGLRFVVQPGGSLQDGEVIQRAKDLGISMILTGVRHFLH